MAQVGDDCYFFYYSSCAKGPSCPFRHVEAALGNEIMCTHWQAGTCTRPGCRFRHFDIQVDRSNTPCFWESQPSGCTKPHCVFKHYKKQQDIDILPTIDEVPSRGKKIASKTGMNEIEVPGLRTAQEVDRASPRIEPVVVNPFEDDSDADSVSGTPQKSTTIVRRTVPQIQDHIKPAAPSNGVPRKTVASIKTKRKIKMSDSDPNQPPGVRASVSDNVLLEEPAIRRNVVISDERDSNAGKSFHDLIKKSKSSLGLVTAPAEQAVLKPSVKKRLGQTEPLPNKISPSKASVKSRLGLESKSDRVSPVTVSIKDRLGAGSDDSTSRTDVKSRLGGATAESSLGLKSLADLRAEKLEIKKQLEEDSGEDSDVPNIKIKSLEEIRAEKAKKTQVTEKTVTARKGWKTNAKPVIAPAKSAPKRKIITYTELFEEEPSRGDNSVGEEPAVKVKSLQDIRKGRTGTVEAKKKSVAPKKERQIYQPPGRKTVDETTVKNLTASVPTKRTITPPPVQQEEAKVAKVKPVADVRVKTFSEIMAEKRKRAMELKAKQDENKRSDNPNPKPKVRITPIVFDADETEKETAPRKSSPVTVKQTISVAPLRSKNNTKLKENVSSVNASEQKSSSDNQNNRLSEGHVLSDNNGCDKSKGIELTISREEPPNKPPSVESDTTTVTSPSKRRTSSQCSDLSTRKKSRQSLNLTEDDDDFFFGTDLEDADDVGKIDEGDLLADIDNLLA